jgi:hypothetical protein
VLLILVCIVGCGASRPDDPFASEGKSTPVMVSTYKKASTERERLLAAIDVLEKGNIRKGGNVREVDEAFGTSFEEECLQMRPGDTTWGTLDFAPATSPVPEGEAASSAGWYLAVEFNHKGTILDYLITNAGK